MEDCLAQFDKEADILHVNSDSGLIDEQTAIGRFMRIVRHTAAR